VEPLEQIIKRSERARDKKLNKRFKNAVVVIRWSSGGKQS